MQWDVIVVGAGAAGLVAAERAAARGLRTVLLEKNRRPGVKILMSGGTRCNITHSTDVAGIVRAFGRQGRFLHSALAQLGPADVVALVEGEGVPTKIEETGKIFPVSNRATDVLQAFLQRLERTDCRLVTEEPLLDLEPITGGFQLTTPHQTLTTSSVIVTSGGKSYPGSGTCGDGYGWAEKLGHTIRPLRPALTPLTTNAEWVRELKGVTIADVQVSLWDPTAPVKKKPKPVDTRRGSFLFTHFGLSGPVVLDISRAVTGHERPSDLILECDFLPELSAAGLEETLQRAAAHLGKRPVSAALPETLPRRLLETLLAQLGIPAEQKLSELSKQHRGQLVTAIKHTRILLSGARGYQKAEVTAGGVALEEVDSSTMQSKLVPGLYWAGEVLDLDGPIGGFNFQAAFSTGWLAGLRVQATVAETAAQ